MKSKSASRYTDKSSGIYAIVNKINDKMYVGSSVILQQRKGKHLWDLRNNKHANRYLQFAFNKYKETNFEFKILEVVENINNLVSREQYWIDFYNCVVPNGYNLAPFAISQLGFKHSNQTKALISKIQIGKTASNKTKLKMSITRSGRTQTEEWVKNRVESRRRTNPPKEKPVKVKTKRIISQAHKEILRKLRLEEIEIRKLLSCIILIDGVVLPDERRPHRVNMFVVMLKWLSR